MSPWEIVQEWDDELRSGDPLHFAGYAQRITAIDAESVRTGLGDRCVVIEGNFDVLGGSMGVVHGEKVVRAIDRATEAALPLVVVTRSGGARMQEGMVSLIQMGRTAAAMGRHRAAGLLSVGVYRHPTTGGVFVSYGSLCDLRAAERDATIGFAGPRVAEAVTGASVQGRSHTAEHALDAGIVDFVGNLDEISHWASAALGRVDTPLTHQRRVHAASTAVTDGAWGEVQEARRADRPTGIDVAASLVSSWTELAGTDPVMRAGLATIDQRRIMVIAHDRHHGTGRPTPDGFRLARRAIALAGRIGIPIVTFIDTPGAEPGSEAELDGIGHEIAHTMVDLVSAPVPTIGICVGEGGSGGALAIGLTDVLFIQAHAVFSVIGPEGAAVILHRDASRAPEVAEQLKLTSDDLHDLGIVDRVVSDDLDELRPVVLRALADVTIGGRTARMDAASLPWVR